ncbi:cyclin dependent kinase 11B [Striga asiatica]|uniref:Cyclin dependent kinase 11B n=1 Tax=Striga asiatica TaxID=4170 RepID=A0A5A7R601_STRAF|nr:cyclin dependent kinase 11B [Striga asiatica]
MATGAVVRQSGYEAFFPGRKRAAGIHIKKKEVPLPDDDDDYDDVQSLKKRRSVEKSSISGYASIDEYECLDRISQGVVYRARTSQDDERNSCRQEGIRRAMRVDAGHPSRGYRLVQNEISLLLKDSPEYLEHANQQGRDHDISSLS